MLRHGGGGSLMARLMEQANQIRTQLGYSAELPFSQVIEKAEVDLGIDKQTSGQPNMVERTELVMRTLGLSVTPSAGTTMGPGLVPVVEGSVVVGTVAPINAVMAGVAVNYGGAAVVPYGGALPASSLLTFPSPDSSGLLQAKDVEGCWICCCFPFLLCALYKKEATGPDSLRHWGCCFPLMLPFEEHRQRVAGTNGFYKVGEPGNVDMHSSESCMCNGLACGIKLC